jgi:hypothetical protein
MCFYVNKQSNSIVVEVIFEKSAFTFLCTLASNVAQIRVINFTGILFVCKTILYLNPKETFLHRRKYSQHSIKESLFDQKIHYFLVFCYQFLKNLPNG